MELKLASLEIAWNADTENNNTKDTGDTGNNSNGVIVIVLETVVTSLSFSSTGKGNINKKVMGTPYLELIY